MKILSVKGARRIGALLCILCMVFGTFSGTYKVYARSTPTITASSETAEGGQNVTVSFNLSGNTGIWGMIFKVGYNHDAMTLNTVTVGEVFAEDEVTMPESMNKDYFLFYASENEIANNSANGKLVSLSFMVNSGAALGDYSVTVDIVQVIDVNGADVSVNAVDGKVTVVSKSEEQTTTAPIPEETITTEPDTERETSTAEETTAPAVTEQAGSEKIETTAAGAESVESVDTSDKSVFTMLLSGAMLIICIASVVGYSVVSCLNNGRRDW